MSFTDIVQEVQDMPLEEKVELQQLLEQYIIEQRRQEIYETYKESKRLVAEGKVKYSSDINELKRMLDE